VNSVHVDVMHFRFLWVGAALLLAAAPPTEISLREISDSER
jgi:hypothetical protein